MIRTSKCARSSHAQSQYLHDWIDTSAPTLPLMSDMDDDPNPSAPPPPSYPPTTSPLERAAGTTRGARRDGGGERFPPRWRNVMGIPAPGPCFLAQHIGFQLRSRRAGGGSRFPSFLGEGGGHPHCASLWEAAPPPPWRQIYGRGGWRWVMCGRIRRCPRRCGVLWRMMASPAWRCAAHDDGTLARWSAGLCS
jgi:hypothetical protein